jgi:hypothetical protein
MKNKDEKGRMKNDLFKVYITQLSQVDGVQEFRSYRSSDKTSNPCKLTKREALALSSELLNS